MRIRNLIAIALGFTACGACDRDTVDTEPSLAVTLGTERDFAALCELRDRIASEGMTDDQIAWLKSRASDKTEVGLTNYADLFIPDRVAAGSMPSAGHGTRCDHDLFTVGGRAQWLLRVSKVGNTHEQWSVATEPSFAATLRTEQDFAALRKLRDRLVSEGMTDDQLAWLKSRASDRAEVGLTNYADLFIPDRVVARKMAFHGHGLKCEHDLFTVGGRAQWLLRVAEVGNTDGQWSRE